MAQKNSNTRKNKKQNVSFFEAFCLPGRRSAKSSSKRNRLERVSFSNPGFSEQKTVKLHILTSFGNEGDNFEALDGNKVVRNNLSIQNISKRNKISSDGSNKVVMEFPKCQDVPRDILRKCLYSSNINNDDAQSKADTISVKSSMTLKDYFDQTDTSSFGSPESTKKHFGNMSSSPDNLSNLLSPSLSINSQKKMRPTNVVAPSYARSNENATSTKEISFVKTFDSSIPSQKYGNSSMKLNVDYSVIEESSTDELLQNIKHDSNTYEFIECVTLQPIGKGIQSFGSTRSLCQSEISFNNNTNTNIPMNMFPLENLNMSTTKQYELPQNANAKFQMMIPSQRNDLYDDFADSNIYENPDLMMNNQRYWQPYAGNNRLQKSMTISSACQRHPPSSLIQNMKFSNSNMRRTSSMEMNKYAHLPTKRSLSNSSLSLENNGKSIPRIVIGDSKEVSTEF